MKETLAFIIGFIVAFLVMVSVIDDNYITKDQFLAGCEKKSVDIIQCNQLMWAAFEDNE